uniref:Perilipin 1 n=1 Tax=Echeneis naucrates TaxID=173247 RepID=A0A665T497_ECHNA
HGSTAADPHDAMLRVSRLPLVRSAVQTVISAYSEVKGRYPLLGLMGGAAEVGIRSISYVAMRQATPLFQTLEPQKPYHCCVSSQLKLANSFALAGLERLEKNFPILNQSTDEVCSHQIIQHQFTVKQFRCVSATPRALPPAPRPTGGGSPKGCCPPDP